MADNPYRTRLWSLLIADLIVRGAEENEPAKAVYETVLDCLWPEIEKLLSACDDLHGCINMPEYGGLEQSTKDYLVELHQLLHH